MRAALARYLPFARSSDGSEVAFWINDEGRQRIVHMAPRSGSTLACVLVESPLDLLRLIAIGYDELCWIGKTGHAPPTLEPDAELDGRELTVNRPYRQWLLEEFGVSAPTATFEVVPSPGSTDGPAGTDAFRLCLDELHEDY